jgi:hypothetical protein
MAKYLLILAISLISMSCREGEKIELYSLKGRDISLPFTVGSASNVIYDQGYFLMRDFKPLNGKYFKLMDNEFRLLAEFGETGDGPYNFKQQPGKVYPQPFMLKDELIVLEGTKIFRFGKFLSDSISTLEITFPTNNSFPQNYLLLNDSLLWINGGSQEHKFFIVNIHSGETLRKINFSPKLSKPDIQLLMFGYIAAPHFNPERDIVIWAHSNHNSIELYNSIGELKKEIIYGETKDISLIDRKDRRPTFFNPIALKDGFIVGLTDEETYGKFLVSDAEIGNVDLDNLKSYLLYFDYDGNLISRISLDQFIGSFCIDFVHQKIIAPVSTNEEFPLIEFQIPKELQKYIKDVK